MGLFCLRASENIGKTKNFGAKVNDNRISPASNDKVPTFVDSVAAVT